MDEKDELKDFDAVAWSRKARKEVSKKYRKPDGSWDWDKWEKRQKELDKWKENDYKDPE